MSFSICDECTDFLEQDAYCHCCFTGMQRRVRELQAEVASLRAQLKSKAAPDDTRRASKHSNQTIPRKEIPDGQENEACQAQDQGESDQSEEENQP